MKELELGSRPSSLSLEDELAQLEVEAGAGTSPLASASSSPRRPVSTSSDEYEFVPKTVLVPREVAVQQRSGLFSGLFGKRSKRSSERK